jgi:stage V sporulation protein B
VSEAELVQEEASDPRHSGFLLNVNLIFVSTLAVNVLSFAIVVVVSRLLGPSGRGVTSLYQTGVNGAYAFISFGAAVGALYYVSRREVSERQAMEAGLSATIGAALLSALGVLVLRAAFGRQLSEADVPYWLIVVAIPLVVQFRMVEVLLRAGGRFFIVSVIEAGVPAATLAGLLAVEALAGLTVGRAIAVWSLSPLPSVLFAYRALGWKAMPRRPALDAGALRLMRFGLQGQAGNIIQLLNYRLDSYLVLLFVNAAGVGLYSVGVAVSEGLWLVANSVAIVLIPKLAASDPQYAARTAPLICRNTLLVTALGAAALGVVSPVAVPLLFGSKFNGSVQPLLWLLPGVVALAGTKVLSAYVFSQGKPLINTYISVGTLVATLAGDLALIPLLGVDGAAIASTLSYGLSLVLTVRAYSRLSGHAVAEAVLPRPSDVRLYLDGARTVLARLRRPGPQGAGAGLGSES